MATELSYRVMVQKIRGGAGLVLAGVTLGLAGCGNNGAVQVQEKKQAVTQQVEYFHPDPATAATVHGRIVFHGVKPPKKLISMEADAACMQANHGKPVYEEQVVTGKDGALSNA